MHRRFGYPLGRGFDHEGGSAADLQTDVMRFMAIISLCLVAIFALVQSLPLDRRVVQPPTPTPTAAPSAAAAEPAATPEAPPPPVAASIPEPSAPTTVKTIQLPPAPAYSPPEAETQDPIPLASTAASVPTAAPAPPSHDEDGFVLRFESDRALFRLIESRAIALYAMRADKTLRLQVGGGSTTFWSAEKPRQFHEMDDSTVPPRVIAALKRVANPDVTWGVTLPTALRSQLDGYLNTHSGGTLIIGQDGKLRLE